MEPDYITYDPRLPKQKVILTNIIIGLICLMFLIEIFFSALYSDKALIILGAKWNEGIRNGEYWRFWTCTFLHGNLLHLFLNTTAIYIFGREVESIFGSFRFLLIYLLTAWGAGLASYHFSQGLAIGASGAVFGIIGALLMFYFKQKEKLAGANMRFKSMYTLIAINIALGFLIPRIDNSAHIGGLLTGIVLGWFVSPEYVLERNEETNKLQVEKKKDLRRVVIGIIMTIILLAKFTYFY